MILYSQSLFFIPSMLSLSNILYIFVVIFYRKWLMWNRGWYGCWHPNFGRQGSTKCRYKSNRSIIKLSKTLMYQTYYMNEWSIYKKSHTQCKNDIFNKFMYLIFSRKYQKFLEKKTQENSLDRCRKKSHKFRVGSLH